MKNTRVLIRAKGRGLCIERGLVDCLQRELFTDLNISCTGGKKLRANKGVLAAASPVFCHLLKEWPHGEDACVIMAGYTEEEVSGLIRYIYTGQLNTMVTQGTVLEKIIQDFRVGFPHEAEDIEYIIEQHEDTVAEEATQPPAKQACVSELSRVSLPNSTAMKGVGPKIVAVTSPRPLVLKVNSKNQQAVPSDSEMTTPSDVPCDVAIENDDDEPVEPKRKRSSRTPSKVVKDKELPVEAEEEETAAALAQEAAGVEETPQKTTRRSITSRKSKSVSPKFGKKKYCCPFCNRRFLTRGNVKNHIRIHVKDKPFQCPICSDYFAYQAVYQRHLVRHKEINEITDEEMAPLVEESLRIAELLLMKGEVQIPVDEAAEAAKKEEGAEDESLELSQTDAGPSASAAEEDNTKDVNEDAEEEDLIDEEMTADDEDAEQEDGIKEEDEEISQEHEAESEGGTMEEKPRGKGKAKESKEKKEDVKMKLNMRAESRDKSRAFLAKPNKGRKKAASADSNSSKNRMNYQILQCDFCPMKYHKWSAFYIHRCGHTGETPVLPCNVCQESFPNIKQLKEHRTREHPDSVFKCDQCERRFLSRSALLMHLPVHSVSLNFQCRYCQARMRTLKERYVHERVHLADVTPYQCSKCDKQFGTLVNLRSHLRLHSAEGAEAAEAAEKQ